MLFQYTYGMSKPLLEVQNLSKAFGRQTVLDQVSFHVSEGQKIALIGRNGAGKSTLLKILTGELSADEGSFQYFDRTHIGVIRQNEVLPDDCSSLQFLEEQSDKPDWAVKKMAAKFGLHEEHLAKPPGALSGGYQMRVKLVAMFLGDPNLLFLDEPVNYLDLQTLLLLEGVLADYRGAFILIAHDRTFLQNTCHLTYEIERGKLVTFKGDVQTFLAWKQEQIQFSKRTNKRLAREIKHTQKFVERFRYKASLASRAQNKLKHINRLKTQIMDIDASLATTRISIPSPHVHPGVALRVEDLAIGYGDHAVAQNINFTVNRGEKIVIAGENGRGKSTLLKTIVHHIKPLSGSAKWWKHADIGYYDQLTSKSLNNDLTVLSHLTQSAPHDAPAQRVLMMAGNFLFKGDDLDKKISVLSGGERARLALAGLLLQQHNVLILDEPTNHLDVETADALATALQEYAGTVLFVSHARTFASTLADRIFEVKEGGVKEYLGDYAAYVDYLADLAALDIKEEQTPVQASPLAAQERKEYYALVKERQRDCQRLEKQIKTLESEKSDILKYFFENPTDYAPPKAQRLNEINEELTSLEEQWMKQQERIETLRGELHSA